MTATPERATVILALLFVSSAFGEVIFSRRVYKEHGATYQQIWTWNPADRKRNVWVQQLMSFN
jgi:hypothetical protein